MSVLLGTEKGQQGIDIMIFAEGTGHLGLFSACKGF